MKTMNYLLLFGLLLIWQGAPPLLADPSGPVGSFDRKELKAYSELRFKLDPTKGRLYDQVTQAFPHQDYFTGYEIEAVTDSSVKKPDPKQAAHKKGDFVPRREEKWKPDAIPGPKAEAYLNELDKHRIGDQKLWNQLKDKLGEQDWYTREQLAAVEHPKAEAAPKKPVQKFPLPAGAIAKAQAQEELKRFEVAHLANEPTWSTMKDKYGDQDWYTAAELRDVIANGAKPIETLQSRDLSDPVRQLLKSKQDRDRSFLGGFRSPRIRQSWRDVLYEEDPSVEGAHEKIGDLTGALFSYSLDNHAHTETWSAVGALILPWKHRFNFLDAEGHRNTWLPLYAALAPSVSIDRIDTNGDPKKEVDSLLYRLGGYTEWIGETFGLQLRAAGVYATDTGGHGTMPGFEVDLEPRYSLSQHFKLGYRTIALEKTPFKPDESDNSLLDYQLRVWLHAEGGDVQDAGSTWDAIPGSFYRLGPTAELRVNFPKTLFGNSLSITALYSYLAALSGPDVRDSFFHATISYKLTSDPDPNHKISLTADYQNGGVVFTKERVDAFTVGLSVLY